MTVAKLQNAHENPLAWQLGRVGALVAALAACVLFAAAALLTPPAARADDAVLGHSEDGATQYHTLVEAWDAAVSGTTVVMDDDWCTTGVLTVGEGKSATIKMNGHKIYRDLSEDASKGGVLWLEKKATLTLDGTGHETTFTIRQFADGDETEVTSGGLITGGNSSNSGGGVEMKEGATLKLVNVAVAGNRCKDHGGGIAMNGEGCVLEMTDAAVDYNQSMLSDWATYISCGGGVYINNEKSSISMTRSSISCNRAELGGGVYSDSGSTKITMREGSKIDRNTAYGSNNPWEHGNGGGVYFNKSFFTIDGDGTCAISNNYADVKGGGIFIDSKTAGNNEGTIKGVQLKWNKSLEAGAVWVNQENIVFEDCVFSYCEATKSNAGALYLEEENTTIRRCTFTDNVTVGYGGAVYIKDEKTTIDSCTMTGNIAREEGGAVWVDYDYDVELAGVTVIKDNRRFDGAYDDVFLDTKAGGGSKAYITGSLASGSKVGVRTGYDDDRRIADDFSYSGYSPLFVDIEGYYVSYGDGDAWQRHAALEFQLTADGQDLGRHKQNEKVTATAVTGAADKAFWRWSADSSLGLDPFADYIADAQSPTVSFAMPQNDVTLVAQYVPRTSAVSIEVFTPEADMPLVENGTLSWRDAEETSHEILIDVSWYEVTDAGMVAVKGNARPGATYVACVTAGMDGEAGLAFALDMGTDDVTTGFRVPEGRYVSVGTASASVDAATESLSVTSNTYTLPTVELVDVRPAQVTVPEGISESELYALLPATATGIDVDARTRTLVATPSMADVSSLLSDGHVVVPEAGTVTVQIPVSSDETTNPQGLYLEVAVTVAPTYLAVTFDAAGGSYEPDAQDVRWGTCAQEPQDAPELENYTFLGWFAEGASEAWDFSDRVTSAMTLTAKWELVHNVVTFDTVGGDPVPAEQSVAYGSCAQEPQDAPVLENYTFLGWFAEGADTAWDFATPVISAITLTARWEPVTISVSFDSAGGAPTPRSQSVKYGTCAQEPAAPQLAGQTFLGWFAEGADTAWDFATPVTSALKLTAKWDTVTYAVDFVFANGQGAQRVMVAHGSVVSAPGAPARDGYAFLGWYTDSGVRYNFSTPVRGGLTLTAWWTPTPTTFADVPADSWYAPWVSQAASMGIMTGYTDGIGAYTGLFGPEDALSRGQVATVLWRMAGCPEASDGGVFPDVEAGMYYSKAVSWCAENGIVTGYQAGSNAGLFLPKADVSREELAVMVWRFERWAQASVDDVPTAAFESLEDGDLVSSWARESCVWCAAAGVMTGKETAEGTLRLDPQQGATRAQAAKMFVRAALIAAGEQPYEAQPAAQADEVDAQAIDVQEAAFDEVTFEDVAAVEAVEASEPVEADAQPEEATEPSEVFADANAA